MYVPKLSRIDSDLSRLLDALALYRLAMGQPDQEQLVRALRRRLEEAGSQQNRLKDWLRAATINLSPFWNKQLTAQWQMGVSKITGARVTISLHRHLHGSTGFRVVRI